MHLARFVLFELPMPTGKLSFESTHAALNYAVEQFEGITNHN